MQNAWDLFQPQLLALSEEVLEKKKKRKAIVGSILLLALSLVGLSFFIHKDDNYKMTYDTQENDMRTANSAAKTAKPSDLSNSTIRNTDADETLGPVQQEAPKRGNIEFDRGSKYLKENPQSIVSTSDFTKKDDIVINNNSKTKKTAKEKLKSKEENLFYIHENGNKLQESAFSNLSSNQNPLIIEPIANYTIDKNVNENKNLTLIVNPQETSGLEASSEQSQYKKRNLESIAILPLVLTQELEIAKEGCIELVIKGNPLKNKLNIGLSLGPAETTIYAERQIRVNGFYYSFDAAYSINKILNVGFRFNHQRYSSTTKYIINPEVNNKYKLSNLMINLGIKIVEIKKTELILNVARGYALENTLKRQSTVINNEVNYEHIQENEYGLNYHVVAQLRYKLKPNYAIGLEALLEDNGYERTLFGININHKF